MGLYKTDIRIKTHLNNFLLLAAMVLTPGIVTPVLAFDQPWNGFREDITGPQPDSKPTCPSGNCTCANFSNTNSPVYTADGSLVWSDTDIVFPTDTRIGLKRAYNSFDYRAGLFGRGWVTAQESNIARTYRAVTEGDVDGSPKTATEFESVPIWLASYGRRYTLTETATRCTTPEVLYFTFEKLANGHFKQVYEDNQSFSIYDENGALMQSYSDRAGSTIYYNYDEQSRLIQQFDSYGFTLNFIYNEQGFVSQVTDQGGRTWDYIYDEYGRLTQVLDPDGNTKDYGYLLVDHIGYKQHLLNSVNDNGDDPVLSVAWENRTIGTSTQMRVASYTEIDGKQHDYTYAAITYKGVAAVRVVKDTKQVGSNATIERQTFIANADDYSIVSDVNNTKNTTSFRTFDVRRNVTEKTDKRGNITQYEYNLAGRRTKIVELAGTNDVKEINISYWKNTDRIAVMNEYGIRETFFTYDSDLRVLTESQVDLSNSQLRIWTYSYHSGTTDSQGNVVLGKVASIDGPRVGTQDTTTFEYNSQGMLVRINYPLNQSIRYSYNAIGQRLTETDVNGIDTEMLYDSKGRLILSNRNNRIIRYRYTSQGLISQLFDELGRATTFTYNNQNQVTRISYPSGDYLSFVYSYLQPYTEITESYFSSDDTVVSQKIVRVDPLSNLPIFGYLDSITKQVYQDQYNEFDDLTQSILYGQFGNASGITTSIYEYTYDRLGRTSLTTNGLNGNTRFIYDSVDRLIEVIDPNNSTTRYRYNSWDDLIRLESSDKGVTVYKYDVSGNRVSKVDANNVQTSYIYDAQNRFIGVDYEGDNLDIALTYDEGPVGRGKLTSISDGSGSSTIEYDDRGLIIISTSIVAGIELGVNYEYDDSGQLIQISYPSGLIIRYNYDEFGRLLGIQDLTSGNAQNLLSNLNWIGTNISSYQKGNGLVTELVYDLTGRLTQKKFGANNTIENRFDNQGQIVQQDWILKGVKSSSAFQYDFGGYLIKDGSFINNFDWLYGYDSIGNRLSKQSSNNTQSETYSYLQNSNRLSQINGAAIQLDAVGNTLDDGFRQFQYNSMNRLQQLTNSQLGIQANYLYNYQGQRVRKQLTGNQIVDIRYIYGLNGELLGEYDSSGNRIKEYVYYTAGDSSELVVQIEQDGTVIYLHADHLSVPRFATDQNQNIVWQWVSSGFGIGVPDEDVDGNGAQVIINHRFAGQYYDLESGLHYNHFRYYNPNIGRYITSDPIALDGGLNTYGYAYQNPIRFSDPSGLAVPAIVAGCAANPVCAAAAAAAARAAAAAAARALASAAALAAAAACAVGLGPCGSDPGNCSRSRHRYLQNVVDNLCKPNPGNCREGEKCSDMAIKLAKHTTCADARRNINRECFRGGDRRHQIEYTNRRQQAATCNGLLATCCP